MSDEGYRVGWLDTAGQPSRIHRTVSTGSPSTTVCGYDLEKHEYYPEARRVSKVPTRIRGRSQYCRICFQDSKKSIPWRPGLKNYTEEK